MEIKWIAALVIALLLGPLRDSGYRSQSGIQPGYFEKQEAPAYGVSDDKPMGSEFGKEIRGLFQEVI